jgi:hypothetical protein
MVCIFGMDGKTTFRRFNEDLMRFGLWVITHVQRDNTYYSLLILSEFSLDYGDITAQDPNLMGSHSKISLKSFKNLPKIQATDMIVYCIFNEAFLIKKILFF